MYTLISTALNRRLREAARVSQLSRSEWISRAVERQLEAESLIMGPVAQLASLGGPTADLTQMLAEIGNGRSGAFALVPAT